MIKRTKAERAFDASNLLLMLVLIFITVYPLYYTLVCSFSDARGLLRHVGPLALPLRPYTLNGYRLTLRNTSIISGFRNSVFYVLFGTVLSLILTAMGAFVVSRKHFKLRKIMMGGIVFTMFFNGGIIPLFFVVQKTGIYDTFWVMFLPWLVSSYNLIILRTFFTGLPDSLEEAAMLDGANDLDVLVRIYIPLSRPALAVLALYYGVGIWNSWYPALVFMRTRSLYPLQMILREVLILETDAAADNNAMMVEESFNRELVKYCTVVVSTVPILVIYPFLQKYFVKGVMIGAIKG